MDEPKYTERRYQLDIENIHGSRASFVRARRGQEVLYAQARGQ